MVLGIYGAGGEGKTVKELAEELDQWDEILFIDDTTPSDIFKGIRRVPFLKFCIEFSKSEAEVIIALGDPKYRIALYEKVKSAGFGLANVIHKTASISTDAVLGRGIIIHRGVIIGPDSVVEDNVDIGDYASIAHDSTVRAHSIVSYSALVAGHCVVEEGVYIGPNASIKDDVKIGAHSVISMGSSVLSDIPEWVTAVGNPAVPMCRRKEEDKLFK